MANGNGKQSRMSRIIQTPGDIPTDQQLKKQAAHKHVVLKLQGGSPHTRLVAMRDALVDTIQKAKWAGAQVNLDLSILVGLIATCAEVAGQLEIAVADLQTMKAVFGKLLTDNPDLCPVEDVAAEPVEAAIGEPDAP